MNSNIMSVLKPLCKNTYGNKTNYVYHCLQIFYTFFKTEKLLLGVSSGCSLSYENQTQEYYDKKHLNKNKLGYSFTKATHCYRFIYYECRTMWNRLSVVTVYSL